MISKKHQQALILEIFDRNGANHGVFTNSTSDLSITTANLPATGLSGAFIAQSEQLITGDADLSDDESAVFQARTPLGSPFATVSKEENGPQKRLVRAWIYDIDSSSSECIFSGYVISTEQISEQYIQVNIANINALVSGFDEGWALSTLCPHRFKGTRCGYQGAETECNKTAQRCAELTNMSRHGGMPFLSVNEEK